MKRLKRLIIIIIILSCSIGCDQATKRIAEESLQGRAPISFFYNTIRLVYMENTGAFLGMGSSMSAGTKLWVFILFPLFVLFSMLIYMLLSADIKTREIVLLAFIIGGGAGNLMDRLMQDGRVSDFLNIGIGNLRTGIFNVADVLIMVGSIGIVFFTFYEQIRQKKREQDA